LLLAATLALAFDLARAGELAMDFLAGAFLPDGFTAFFAAFFFGLTFEAFAPFNAPLALPLLLPLLFPGVVRLVR